MGTNGATEDAGPSEKDKIWRSESSVSIDTQELLSFVFAKTNNYDQDKPIFIDPVHPSEYFSARKTRRVVRRLIAGLKQRGLREGDCICICAFNNIYYPLIWLAVIGAGGVVSGSNPAYKSTLELAHHFKTVQAKYVFAQKECRDAAEQAVKHSGISRDGLFILGTHEDGVLQGLQTWDTLLLYGECDWNTNASLDTNVGEKIACYNMTSGTTGMPKAAKISERFIVAQTLLAENILGCRDYEPIQLISSPVFHAYAQILGLVLPLRLGITTYFMERFSFDVFATHIRNFSITDIAIVPKVLASLSKSPIGSLSLKSIRYVLCAGAPLPVDIQLKLYDHLSPHAVITQNYGTTELAWVSMFPFIERDDSGSIGRLLPGIELKLVDDSAAPINQDNIPGEALIRSPAMFSGYFENSEETAQAFDRDGFYRTGDLIHVKDGKLYYHDRLKDTMKVNGWQVSPTELEQILLQHSLIADAAVIGVKIVDANDLEDTRPKAFVVARTPASNGEKNDLSLTEDEVKEFVAARVARFKRLAGGVEFVKEIPRSSAGKILRRELLTK